MNLDKPVEFWKNVLWSNETKLFWTHGSAVCLVPKGKAYEQKNTISMVKHGGPILFAVTGSVNLDCMQDIMDSLRYQAILANIVMPSVQRLKLDDQ